jgi:hypothetical protein
MSKRQVALVPTERVFRFVTDLGAWKQWHGQGEAEKIAPGPVGVGTPAGLLTEPARRLGQAVS